jgi:hypothetical protein
LIKDKSGQTPLFPCEHPHPGFFFNSSEGFSENFNNKRRGQIRSGGKKTVRIGGGWKNRIGRYIFGNPIKALSGAGDG